MKVAMLLMALFMASLNATAQEETSVEKKTTKSSITTYGTTHDEEFEHTTVHATLDDGTTCDGFYKVVITFEGNNPIRLTFVLKGCTSSIFTEFPAKGTFKTDSGNTAVGKFVDMFNERKGIKWADVKFDR